MATESVNRHFCSNLVSVQLPAPDGGNREVVGNLEEISTSEACLNVEEPILVGFPLRMVCSDSRGTCELLGTVVGCRHDARTGYYVDIEFSPDSRWSPEVFAPKHMIRASALLSARSEEASPETDCCERGICPKEVISRLLEPEFPLSGRVHAVAREVAALCGELTEGDAAACFSSLFGAGPECCLFAEFREAYTEERRSGPHPRHIGLRNQVEALVQLAGAVPTEALESDSCQASAPWITPLVPPSQ